MFQCFFLFQCFLFVSLFFMANSSNFGFGIFRREWAYWAWEIYWYEGTTKVHGSDGGLFVKEERPLHRLRERFFYGVVLNKHRSGKAYSELVERFEVYYINTESRQKTGIDYQHDFHMFTLTYADNGGTPSLLVKPTAQAYTLLRDNMDFLLQITAEANLVMQQKTQAATSMQSRLNMLAKPVTDLRPGQPGG